jgi:Protein of unknown function (DUF3046)
MIDGRVATGRVQGAAGCEHDGNGAGRDARCGEKQKGRYVRLTDFWSRLEEAFGPGYARSFAADHAFADLGGRTIDEAIAQGMETATVWRVVVAAYPDRVPVRLR